MYKTGHTESYPTPSDFIFKTEQKLQKAHHLIWTQTDVEQGKAKYALRLPRVGAHVPRRKASSCIFPNSKKMRHKGQTLSTRVLTQLSKLLTTLIFGLYISGYICVYIIKNFIKVHYDRLKQSRCREQTSVKLNEAKRQRELKEKPFLEEVDDDFIETNRKK